jgi:hypothetical protein
MRNIVGYICILILFSGCNLSIPKPENEGNAINEKSEIKIDGPSNIAQDTIVNDDFMMKFYDEDLKISNFQTKLNITNKESRHNKHDDRVIDTIVTYTNSKDTIISYKGSEREMITHLICRDQNIQLLKSISNIGLIRKDFLIYFSSKNTNNIIISDTEGGNLIILNFKDEKLSKVEYKAIYFD